MLCGQHLKNCRRICKKKQLLDGDGASQILFYLNTYLRERRGKLDGSFPSYQIDPQPTYVLRLCIEKKKQFEQVNGMTIKSDIH